MSKEHYKNNNPRFMPIRKKYINRHGFLCFEPKEGMTFLFDRKDGNGNVSFALCSVKDIYVKKWLE